MNKSPLHGLAQDQERGPVFAAERETKCEMYDIKDIEYSGTATLKSKFVNLALTSIKMFARLLLMTLHLRLAAEIEAAPWFVSPRAGNIAYISTDFTDREWRLPAGLDDRGYSTHRCAEWPPCLRTRWEQNRRRFLQRMRQLE
jgi:hypothetical protein